MNRLFILSFFHFLSLAALAQSTVKPDVQRMMSMSPAQREKYADSLTKAAAAQVTKIADEYGLAVDETVLPGYEAKPPVKDLARLSLIPSRPPTRTELVAQVQKSQVQLQSVMPAAEVSEIKTFSARESLAVIHNTAVARFYNNEPDKALLLMMGVVARMPDSILAWNNLAAMYNMTGLQHRAIPMLQYCLQAEPGSSLILNNLGQSYFGLGDISKCIYYLKQCLAIDSLNPDANHAMGMVLAFEKKFDQAMEYFNRELSVALRMSTLAQVIRMGKKVNLHDLQKQRDRLNNRPQRDFFEEINLSKFRIPPFPSNIADAYGQVSLFNEIAQSVQAESQFWMTTSMPSEKEMLEDGKKNHGLYSAVVDALLDELHVKYTPQYLGNISDEDVRAGMEIINKYGKALMEVKCPKPPAGASIEVQEAYEFKCCKELRQPIYNQRLNEYSGLFEPKIKVAQGRWKSYINELISIVQLDPSLANKMMVYRTVSAYFTFIATSMLFSGTTEAVSMTLPVCNIGMEAGKADSVIKANRDWNLQCPAWLNVEIDLEFGKIKADCSKYGFEVGSSLMAGYEYEFKTGRSTLLAGYGIKGKFFAGTGKVSMKEMVFLTFDNNNEFADFGIRSKVEIGIADNPINVGPVKVGGTLAGVEGTLQLGINSGLTSYVKGKGVLADFIKIDRSL